jgi:sugar/nucleoside kinase (ribokinase family)
VLPLVDVFSPSVDDLRSALGIAEGYSTGLVERLAEEFVDAGVAIVAISAGAEGMYVRTAPAERIASGGQVLGSLSSAWANQRFWMRPVPVAEAVTTNGAGDAATSGLLYGLWLGLDPQETGRLAIACAATLISGRPTTRDAIARVDEALAARVVERAVV